MRKLLLATAAVLALAGTTQADDITTRQLINWYHGHDGPEKLGAITYALGLGLGYLGASVMTAQNKGEELFCPPPKVTVNAQLVVSTLESFVKVFPFAADKSASTTLGFALTEMFPCPKSSRS
jgi:opacity protein-like surface antigen